MEFVCRVGTPEGRVLQRVFQARDESALRADLEKQGIHVFEVARKGRLARAGGGLERSLRLTGRGQKGLSQQEFLIFNQELAALLRAGLPLLQALDLMLERMENQGFRAVLSDIRDRVSSGEELSDAFAAYGNLFPRLYPASLKAGERSGELEAVIRRFIRYQRLMLEARKRAISALVYPAVLIGLSIALIVILIVYVVPRFTGFYADLDAELPALTRAIVALSLFVSGNWFVILPSLVVAGGLGWRWSRTPAGRLAVDRWKLRLPLVGPVFKLFALSELCRSLATLLAGGIPLVQAFEIATEAVGNASVRARIEPNIRMVREGKSFHEAIEQSGVFPPMAIDMAKVGEATGALDEMLSNVSDFFDEKVEVQVQRLLTLVEPMMLVFMGVIVAVILLSLYLPMFSMLGQVG